MKFNHFHSFANIFSTFCIGLEDNEVVEMDNFHHFSTSDLLQWSKQIADGMDFLSSKKIVHRDLAARNVLLNNEKMVKISDFGLAKDVHKYLHGEYYKISKKSLPFKWMAPESLAKKSKFSSASDVWSYGMISQILQKKIDASKYVCTFFF